MKRGDVVLIREAGTPASKARPYVVVQRNSALDDPQRVTACPMTSQLHGTAGQRPFVAPTLGNGLRKPSEVEVDLIYTHPIEKIGAVIGHVDLPTMHSVDIALRRWLDL